ncbi:MAG: winged helix DNA-binding protein [Nanoarchaeota archaeon]|nr:winged helix DNA-binding protein [Nanoarchaeota archaeon]
MDWEIYSSVVRGKYRKKVVLALKVERIPSQIAKITKISSSHVSRALSELRDKGLVECINAKDTSGRIYRLTKKGREIMEHLERSESG